MNLVVALVFSLVNLAHPAYSEPQSVNSQMKMLAGKLGLSFGKKKKVSPKRISLGEFLEKMKPMMTELQYGKFLKYIEPNKNKELPDVTIEANNFYLKEGQGVLRLQAERDPKAIISVAGVSIPNNDFEDVDAALKTIEALIIKDKQKNVSVLDNAWSELLPEAQAWLWPLAIVGAAGLFGYFLYKGLTNMNANVNVKGGTTNTLDVKTESNINFGINSQSTPTLNIYNTSPAGATR